PKYCLAETPQALTPRRLGRQSAERERISEISCNLNLKTETILLYSSRFFLAFKKESNVCRSL
ncbi:hypothetical protein, partial [Peribacillus sp. YIM B13477]|uniref:hypothetical protein n=1 Tax=Peribacillus sp. YIM B13477 TaxID=3366300 RepID=UPI00366FCA9C